MLSLDLFNTVYERALNEGAVDDLEARHIHGLNTKMLELMSRAKNANPEMKAALKREYAKIKDERDSYYKVREAGIPGSVPTEKIPGKEDLLKGRGRSYYEADQKKNSEQVNEYLSMGSDKNYIEADPYKNYRIYVRKKPFGNTGMYTAHTEIDRKEFMGKGPSQEEAVQAIHDRIDFVLNAQKKVTGSSTIDFNVKFATDLLADPRQTFYAKLENINGEPKLVIAGADVASDPELLAAGDFKRSAIRNQVDDQGRATPLPGIALTAKGLRSGNWIANGRYTIGNETQDRDGNRVFDLTYHSTAHTKSDKLRLNQPAFTLGTARDVDEDSSSKPLDQKLQRLKTQARRQFPRAHSDDEALILKLLDKETQDNEQNRRIDARQDAEIKKNFAFDRDQENEIQDLQTQVNVKEHGGGIGPKQRWQDLMQERKLNIGDPIVVTAPNEFEGKTGEIYEFSPSGKFVVVDLYNHGKQSMHLSDVEYNQYAADQEDEDDWYVDEGFQDFNKVEPYAVCLAGRPVKKFDYYEDARRFHDNWKAKLYREGDRAKAEKITLLPLGLDEAEDRVDPILIKALNNMPDGLADHHSILNAAYDAYTMEVGKIHIKQNYGVTHAYIPKLMQLYKDKYGLDIKETKADPTGSWVVYGGSKVMKFKTHGGATAYAQKNGGKVASSEFYADKVQKKQVNEFAPGADRDDNDEVPDQILTLANRWWNATDDQPKITNVLRSLGWSIAQVESEDDAVQMQHDDGTTYFISADDFDPDVFEAETDYSKRRQRERDVDAGKPVAKQRQSKMTDYQKRRAQDKKDMELGEVKTRLDPKCWTGKKIGTPKTKVKGGVRVNNCVPANESYNFTSVNLTESKTYKLWESAGRKLVEAQLTPAQIQQVFQQAEQGATTAGGNRTGLGQVKDAGSAVAQAWEQLKTKVTNSGPVKNVDAYYDQAAEKLKQATGGDAGVMQYVEKYRTFAKAHPVAQSLIYSALIAAAGISGAGAGGAAALGLFKLVDKLLQGEKFSSAAYSGAKTGALAYGAGQVGQATQGADQATAVAGGPTVINPNSIISQIQNGTITDQQSLLKAISGVDNRQQQIIWKVLQNTAGAPGSSNVAGIIQAIANPGLKESQIRQAFYVASGLQTQLTEGVWDSIKGAASKAAGAVANKAKTVGHNLTTRVTADKLMSAWQSAGSPTDSKAVADVMRNAGVTDAIITSVMNAVVKRHTGGRVAGQLSQTPNAIRQRQARAAKKSNPGAIGQMANQLTTAKSSTGGMVSKTGSGTVHRASATNPNQPTNVAEDQDTSGVERAILNRIMTAHTDLLMRFGPEKVMQAAEEVAYNVGDVDEVGSSDVSAWVHEVKQILGAV